MVVFKHYLLTFALGLLVIRPGQFEEAAEEEDLCNDRSCYPATGNLLLGRKDKLSATSSCGLYGPNTYCIVSHLEDTTKCFKCDSRQPWSEVNKVSHRIENVVSENYNDRTRNWWQSENGVQNVSIRLDLDAEFHFTHLIMTFRSFRPAAMLIERSADFGKTWSIYRYFAYDCASSFSDIPEGPPKNHSDVICTRKYSDVAPSTGGEIVYKVISPHIPTENPYAEEIANLLKVTNLRINFTKLHTLGDDLLDHRAEIDKKYFYAVYELVVRGSCSCYGHAQRCIPMDNGAVAHHPDMVHGRCECTHNTKGLNCEQCQDFFNDLPWRPAIGEQSNECKRCNCNGHANRCHFDEAVYNASGFVSGGVCDDCAHNTQGQHCEQCKPYFYRVPNLPLHHPHICRQCECDKRGSLNEGICESEQDEERDLVAGKCYCKTNVEGNSCDRCKNGFWNLTAEDPDGCQHCTCNLFGTFNNLGCDKYTGHCTCKPLVTGENCDQCLPQHYGLSEDYNGCKPCNCDIGGALNNDCDILTGQCACRDHFTGRRCNETESSYYCPAIDHYTYEAEETENIDSTNIVRETKLQPFTGEGFVSVARGTNLTFTVRNLAESGNYNIIIRYNLVDQLPWEDIKIVIVRPGDPNPNGPCGNIQPQDDFLIARLEPQRRYIEVYPEVCFDQGEEYNVKVHVGNQLDDRIDTTTASALIDSVILTPNEKSVSILVGDDQATTDRRTLFAHCRHLVLDQQTYIRPECQELVCPVAALHFNTSIPCQCDLMGSKSGICQPAGGQCECKSNVVGRQCDRCAVGFYGFGPNGCSACDCNSIGSLSYSCDKTSGQCPCRERGITGRQCNECQPGFWGFPECRTCQCNGHATLCDQTTGHCIDCKNLTDGASCDRCKMGYYGDPRLGSGISCKACPCPGGPGSGKQHADSCYLSRSPDQQSTSIVCSCKEGYTGDRCDECGVNYWGNPEEVGGSCESCDCNGNIDRRIPESCDRKTGDCLKCLYNTEGSQCENCVSGFFGDAKLKNCQRCVCNHLGSKQDEQCDRVDGQCPCLPNVVGMKCDECAPLHFNLSSGIGCDACDCDPTGVVADAAGNPILSCNGIDGRCQCKYERGGRTCSQCQDLYWGDPVNGECKLCQCDPNGSTSLQCNRLTGLCVCNPGSGGAQCNQCARGYTGNWPYCSACGECFDNWDRILQGLKNELDDLVLRANSIEDKGISSQYDDRFENMEQSLDDVRAQMDSINITRGDVDELKKLSDVLKKEIDAARELTGSRSTKLNKLSAAADITEADVDILANNTKNLKYLVDKLSKNATEIRRSDVQGAYELVRESVETSRKAHDSIQDIVANLTFAEKEQIRAKELLLQHDKDFEAQYSENQKELQIIHSKMADIEKQLPILNKQVCGAESAPCDALCGGPGDRCGQCGGSSCSGSITSGQRALEFAQEADTKISAKKKEAEEQLKRLRDIVPETVNAKSDADKLFDSSNETAAITNEVRAQIHDLQKQLEEYQQSDHVDPQKLYDVAESITKLDIPHTAEDIEELTEKIRQKVSEMKNTDQILEETRGNKTLANELQKSAEFASQKATEIKNITIAIRDSLEDAKAAQATAREKLNKAKDRLEKARNDLVEADTSITNLEENVKNATDVVDELQKVIDNLKAEYIKITSSSRTAGTSATAATDIAEGLASQEEELQTKYKSVEEQLNNREVGNEDKKVRAAKLRAQTNELLAKINRHNEGTNELDATAAALEVEFDETKDKLDIIGAEIEKVTKLLTDRTTFHTNCDA